MTDTLFLIAFRHACAAAGCPLCTLSEGETRRYLGNLLYEYTTAPDIHQRLAQSHGLCNTHAWLLKRIAQSEENDGLGVGIFYATVVKTLVDRLDTCIGALAAPARGGRPCATSAGVAAAAARLRPERDCLACEHQRASERYAIGALLDEVRLAGGEGELARLFVAGDALCMPHLLRALERASSGDVAHWLARVERGKLSELASQLDLYVRKHDVRYKDEPEGAEHDSWVRAIEACAGKRGVPVVMGPAYHPRERR